MANFTAKDVQTLRQATGAGMMDAKKALTECDGDMDAASKLLREKGLGKAAARSDRDADQGAVALAIDGNKGAIVELKSETDFVAKNPDFKAMVQELADLVLADGESAVDAKKSELEDMTVTLKENIGLGQVTRIEAADGNVVDSYLHVQSERGVNAVLVEIAGGSQELAHDIAVHIGFAKPKYLSRDEVPEADVAAEREVLEKQTRAEGKPEQAMAKIVDGKINAFFRELCLLDQKFAKDEKQTVAGLLGDAKIVRFAQVVIGG